MVALHPEGVDRNTRHSFSTAASGWSPSTRRAWIEIGWNRREALAAAESPSTRRAWIEILNRGSDTEAAAVALHPEGVDRNRLAQHYKIQRLASPSTRRAWIEII